MNPDDVLTEWERLAQEATEGPWRAEQTAPSMRGENWHLRIAGKPGIRAVVSEYQHGPGNAEFIAAARTAWPAATAALRAVLGLHVSLDGRNTWCRECEKPYPCPTVQAVNDALGGQR